MKNTGKYLTAVLAVLLAAMLILSGCGSKTLVCDRCGKEYKVPESSNMEQDWINYCSDCAEELGLNDIVSADR